MAVKDVVCTFCPDEGCVQGWPFAGAGELGLGVGGSLLLDC